MREAGSAQGSPAVPDGPTLLPKLGGHHPSDPSFSGFAVSMGRALGVEVPRNAGLLSQLEWCPLERSTPVLPLRTCECDLMFRNRVFADVIKLR